MPREWIRYPAAPIRKSHRPYVPSRPVEGEVHECTWRGRYDTLHRGAEIVKPRKFHEVPWDEWAEITIELEPERTQRETTLGNLDLNAMLDGIRRSPSPSEEEQEAHADATIK